MAEGCLAWCGARGWIETGQRVTPDQDNAGHIMAVTAGPPGVAYVGWLTGGPIFPRPVRRFSQYLRPFSIHKGWLAGPIRVSRQFGHRNVWPGDTIGISLLPAHGHVPQEIQLSWGGSAVSGPNSQIFTATVRP